MVRGGGRGRGKGRETKGNGRGKGREMKGNGRGKGRETKKGKGRETKGNGRGKGRERVVNKCHLYSSLQLYKSFLFVILLFQLCTLHVFFKLVVILQTYTHMEIMRWVLVCIIGILTGLVAFGIDMGVKQLFKIKYSQFERGWCVNVRNVRISMAFI